MYEALIPVEEAARRLGISVKTLRGHVRDGALPRVFIGHGTASRHYRIDPADIEAFIRKRKEYGAPPSLPTRKQRQRALSPSSSHGVFDFAARLQELKQREELEAEERRKAARAASRDAEKQRIAEVKRLRAERKRESAERSARFKAANWKV